MQDQQPLGSVTTCLSIGGQDFDPELLSRTLGVMPTSVWRPRAEAVRGNPNFNQVEWRYEIKNRPHWSLDDAIREILGIFADKREQIATFSERNKCSLHLRCLMHGDSTIIIYEIRRGTLELLAALGCSFSFWVDPLAQKEGESTGTGFNSAPTSRPG